MQHLRSRIINRDKGRKVGGARTKKKKKDFFFFFVNSSMIVEKEMMNNARDDRQKRQDENDDQRNHPRIHILSVSGVVFGFCLLVGRCEKKNQRNRSSRWLLRD